MQVSTDPVDNCVENVGGLRLSTAGQRVFVGLRKKYAADKLVYNHMDRFFLMGFAACAAILARHGWAGG